MSAPRPAAVRALLVGTVLVLLGLACWAAHAVQSRREARSFTAGGSPPAYVRLVSGHTYWLAIPGGVKREAELGVQPSAVQCTAAAVGQAPGSLSVTPQQSDSKATNQIASFTSGRSGDVHVECDGLGTVYVDNASGVGFDWSSAWLVLTSIALAVGIPLTLSGLRGVPGGGGGAHRRASGVADLGRSEHFASDER